MNDSLKRYFLFKFTCFLRIILASTVLSNKYVTIFNNPDEPLNAEIYFYYI